MNYDELDLSRFSLETTSPLKCIAGIFPENRLTLLHGVQGSGKTYSTIKALNRAKIKPIYLALEGTDGLDGLDFDGVNSGLLKVLMDHTNTYSPLKGRTVIIDTYTVLRSIWFVPHGDGSDESLTSKLIWMCKHHDITLIVIGHTKQNAGISNTFVDNLSLVRGASEELHLDVEFKKVTGEHSYSLRVKKGRGTGGAKVITNWMRD